MLYVDYNATAPMRKEVLKSLEHSFKQGLLNASSPYSPRSNEMQAMLLNARRRVAKLVDADAEEVVFTSGSSEACVQAILGAVLARRNQRTLPTLLTSTVEHPAVREATQLVAREPFGCRIAHVGLRKDGSLQPFPIAGGADVLSVMAANNESGIFFELANIFAAARAKSSFCHSDVTQIIGKEEFSFKRSELDAASLSSHKIGGPKGIGALIFRAGNRFEPILKGGGQQEGRRGGTLPIELIQAFGIAAECAEAELAEVTTGARDAFEHTLAQACPECIFVGSTQTRLPNTSLVLIEGVLGAGVATALSAQGVVIGTGSACASNKATGSFVVKQMGFALTQALSAIRVSFGPLHREFEGKQVANAVAKTVAKERSRLNAALDLKLKRVQDERIVV